MMLYLRMLYLRMLYRMWNGKGSLTMDMMTGIPTEHWRNVPMKVKTGYYEIHDQIIEGIFEN